MSMICGINTSFDLGHGFLLVAQYITYTSIMLKCANTENELFSEVESFEIKTICIFIYSEFFNKEEG